jgi:hypothetical protein
LERKLYNQLVGNSKLSQRKLEAKQLLFKKKEVEMLEVASLRMI